MKYLDEYRRSDLAAALLDIIARREGTACFMEVCGTHTMAISRAGLRPLLAPTVELVSGPGCPVCVTDDTDIDRAIAVAQMPGVILATFGDMMRVPGSVGSLMDASARGARVSVVYSPLDAVRIAENEPDSKVVFLGIGFETTAPAVAATLLEAERRDVRNFYVLSLHKLVPPALRALASMPDLGVDGFLLPGHVSAVIGSEAYRFLPEEFGIPCVIAGFEVLDILGAVMRLLRMVEEGAALDIEYTRAVRPEGNRRAVEVMRKVMRESDAVWRGLGLIEGSGLSLREEYAERDASLWSVEVPETRRSSACRCGEVITGKIRPFQCPLFAAGCDPDDPAGPCMVSSEGTCASYYLYERDAGGWGP